MRKGLLKTLGPWLVLTMVLTLFAPLAYAEGPPEPEVSTADQAGLTKIAPDLRPLAKARSEELTEVTVLMTADADWRGLIKDAVSRKPLGNLRWVTGKVKGRDLLKLAGLEGVISIISFETYQPVPAPGLEELRKGPDFPSPEEMKAVIEKGGKEALIAKLEELRVRIPRRPKAQAVPPMGGIEPATIKVKDVHKASEAWAKGFEGEGVTVSVVDTGVDFGHPDLMNTWATVPSGPYAGWPYGYDTLSGYFYAADSTFTIGPDTYWDNVTWTWYAHTLDVPSPTCTPITCTALLKIDYGFGVGWPWPPVSKTFVFSNTSQSGNYRYTVHPDYFHLQAGYYLGLGYAFTDIAPAAVLLVDEGAAGVYDTVYVDLDFDQDFTDEMPLSINNPATNKDLDGDGVGDLSSGLLTWISDGANPPPGMNVLYENPPVPDQGRLIAFVGDSETHGTNCTGDVVAQGVITDPLEAGPIMPVFHTGPVLSGMAPKAKVAAFEHGFWLPFDSWTLSALGFDGLPRTGDEAHIVSNSWGASATINDGWDATSRFAHWLNRNYFDGSFLVATGNGGHGYWTVTEPDGGTIIGVGASTRYGTLTAFEPITYTDQLTFGDVQPWSCRGANTLGVVEPNVVAVGAWGTGANPINLWAYYYGVPAGNFAYDVFGGTSMACPIAAGNLALVYQAYKSKYGSWPTWDKARTILMNGADDLGYDVLVQGAGNVNADRATDIAAGLGTFSIYPAFWTAGDYRGAEYPAFPNIMPAGGSSSKTFQVTNPATTTANIILSDAILERYEEITFTLTITDVSVPPFTLPNWVTDITNIISTTNPAMVRAQVVFPFEQFDVDANYSYDSGWRVYFYDWTDVNGDTNLWVDANGNGLVDAGEIDDYEYNRFTYGYPAGDYLEASLGEGKSRMHDGVFFGIQRRYALVGGITTTFQVRLSFYRKADWGWLSLDKSSLSVSGGGSDSFQATMSVPAGTRPGIYEGALYAEDVAHTTVIPVVVNVATDSPSFSFGAQSLTEPIGDLPYDNGHLFGGFDWDWRYESGDWKLYYFDLPAGTSAPGKSMVVDTQWVHGPPPPPVPIFSEGFETWLPTGWTTYATGATDDPGWLQGTTGTPGSHGNPHGGTYYAWHNDDNTTEYAISWLVTPRITVPITNPVLSFWQRDYWQAHYYYHGVWITTDPNPNPTLSTYVELWSDDTGDTWIPQVVKLSAYAGQQVYIAFRYEGDYDDEWYIDDVAVHEYEPFASTDVDTWVYGSVRDVYSTNDPAFFGPQSVELVGGSDDTNIGGGVFTFKTATGGPREVVGAEQRDGLGFIALHNVLYAGKELHEPFWGRSYGASIQPPKVEITTGKIVGSPPYPSSESWTMTFKATADIVEGIAAEAYGLSQPQYLRDQTIYQDDPADECTASRVYSIDIANGAMLDVSTTSAAPALDIDLYIYLDDGDGVWECTPEDTLVGSSTTPVAEEQVKVTFPADGLYWITVHGWSVPGGVSTFDTDIYAIYGTDMVVTRVPTGPIPANTPVTFTTAFTKTFQPRTTWEGLIFVGPASAPTALQVPVTVNFITPTIALTLTKSASQDIAGEGDVFTYTLGVSNMGTDPEGVSIVDPMPSFVEFIPGSQRASIGATPFYNILTKELSWSGLLDGSKTMKISFQVRALSGSGWAENVATATGALSGQKVEATAKVMINPVRIHLPIIMKNYTP